MTVGTFQIGNVLKTYTKVMKNTTGRAARTAERVESNVQDMVSISNEGKMKQVRDMATRDIIDRVKETK